MFLFVFLSKLRIIETIAFWTIDPFIGFISQFKIQKNRKINNIKRIKYRKNEPKFPIQHLQFHIVFALFSEQIIKR